MDVREINLSILDEIDIMTNFIENLSHLKFYINNCSIRTSGSNRFKLSDFHKHVKQNIENKIPTIQYSINGKYDGNDISNELEEYINELKDRINSSNNLKIDHIIIKNNSQYKEQSTNNKPKVISKFQEFRNKYLITKTSNIELMISIIDMRRTRYNEDKKDYTVFKNKYL